MNARILVSMPMILEFADYYEIGSTTNFIGLKQRVEALLTRRTNEEA